MCFWVFCLCVWQLQNDRSGNTRVGGTALNDARLHLNANAYAFILDAHFSAIHRCAHVPPFVTRMLIACVCRDVCELMIAFPAPRCCHLVDHHGWQIRRQQVTCTADVPMRGLSTHVACFHAGGDLIITTCQMCCAVWRAQVLQGPSIVRSV
jgi:hypothetical protein